MSASIQFIRRKGDSRVYADIQDDTHRDAWYQPVSDETLKALGITDANIKYDGKIDNSLIRGSVLDASGLQQVAQRVASGGPQYGVTSDSLVAKLADGNAAASDFGTYDTNYDPTTPDQEKHNLEVAAQMGKQTAQPGPTGGAVSAAGFDSGTNQPQNQTYTIKSGDTLSTLAKKNNTTVAALMAANPQIKDANKIYAGASLTIPGQTTTTPPVNAGSAPATGDNTGTDPWTGLPYAGVTNGAGATNSNMDFSGYSDMPPDIINSQEWKQLSDDQKRLAYFTYKTQTATDEAQKKDMQDALNKAMELADPYYKEQIRIAQDEIGRSTISTTEDAKSKQKTLQDRVDAIKQDLAFNKGQLTLEQQAELGKQLRDNQTQLFDLGQSMADSGLAYSSPRQLGEQNLLAEQQGITESTNRKYAQANYSLDTAAQRGLADNTQQQSDLARQTQENLTNISRKGEQLLGTSNTPAVPGVDNLGGVTGQLSEDKQRQVLSLQDILMKRQDPFGSTLKTT